MLKVKPDPFNLTLERATKIFSGFAATLFVDIESLRNVQANRFTYLGKKYFLVDFLKSLSKNKFASDLKIS